MKPIEEIAYDVPQFLKDRAAGLSIEEQAKLYNLTRTKMEKGWRRSCDFVPYGEPMTTGVLESEYVTALLVCEGVMVGIATYIGGYRQDMFFDKNPTYFQSEGACRTGSDYYAFEAYGSEYKWTYEG